MRKFGRWLFAVSLLFFVFGIGPAQSQNGTSHGVSVTWTASTQGSDTNAIQGYIVLRCPGTGTTACPTAQPSGGGLPSGWTALNVTADAQTSYLDSSTGSGAPQAGQSYSYTVYAVDSAGNLSGWSNIATVSIPASGFVANPTAPSGCSAKVQ